MQSAGLRAGGGEMASGGFRPVIVENYRSGNVPQAIFTPCFPSQYERLTGRGGEGSFELWAVSFGLWAGYEL